MTATEQEFVERGIQLLEAMIADMEHHKRHLEDYLHDLKEQKQGEGWP